MTTVTLSGAPIYVTQRLQVRFATEEEFAAEFAANIANGGIFVATPDPPEVRSQVEVEVHLDYRGSLLSLVGEVVHCLSPELAVTGASPGAAVHFTDSLSDIHEKFAPYTASLPSSDDPDAPPDPRKAKRFPASVATRIRAVGQPESASQEGRTRDISRYGALVASHGPPTPIGESITITITHPGTGEEFEVDGKVMRHELSESGEVIGLGVEFHMPDDQAAEAARFLEDVHTREHSRRLGAITGPIEELDIGTLLNMFGTCSPSGTLTVTRGAEEGYVAFQAGMLRVARLGALHGREALMPLLEWNVGHFEFEACVDESRFEGEPVSLEEAILDAARRRDETRRGKIRLRADTTLSVDSDAAEEAADELSQLDRAVLDLAVAGMAVGKIVEIIPQSKREIAVSLSTLVKRGILTPA